MLFRVCNEVLEDLDDRSRESLQTLLTWTEANWDWATASQELIGEADFMLPFCDFLCKNYFPKATDWSGFSDDDE